MIKCKVWENADCGKLNCCYTCDEWDDCDYKCDFFDNRDDTDILKTCTDAEEVGEIVDLTQQVPEVIKAISDICTQKKNIEAQEKEMKQKLQEVMEQFGVKSFKNDVIEVTYVAPTTRISIDSTKLKKELPEVAEKYSKTSNVSASIRIKVK
ncbi:putative bacteriophage endonuclease [Lachnospiraceae bacterium TWA4]|nr:putative bacteriophage endonuclease [Lachnospiraceae bacterium TWA4]